MNYFSMLVTQSGEYTVYSSINEEVFDYIPLQFAIPDTLNFNLWTHDPTEDVFRKNSNEETITLPIGGQIAFSPELLANGETVIGGSLEITIEPSSAALEIQNIYQIYESKVETLQDSISMIFVETGPVQLIIKDVGNDLVFSRNFEVVAPEDTTDTTE